MRTIPTRWPQSGAFWCAQLSGHYARAAARLGKSRPRAGAVVFVQRFDSGLRLDVYFHVPASCEVHGVFGSTTNVHFAGSGPWCGMVPVVRTVACSSYALTVTLGADDRTLTDKDEAKFLERVRQQAKTIAAELRG